MPKKLVVVCLLNFFVAASLGLALRYSFIDPLPIYYRFLTHAHSHVAMLGWVYLMLYTLIVHYFVPVKNPVFNTLFWLTEIAVLGMMVSFPFQGYAAVSISFSTIHILCSYYFAYLIWKYHKTNSLVTRYLLRASLLFMLLSTIGVWCLGPAVAMVGQASAFYQIAIQFFLHFQFNGWFIIAVIALFFHQLQLHDSKKFRLFFKLLVVSTVLTFALPVYWFAPHISLLWINGLGVLLQLTALFMFLKLSKPLLVVVLKGQSKLIVYLYSFAVFCFILKIVLQSVSLIPEISKVIYLYHNFVIGFIHLTMLGVVTGFLFSFIVKSNLVRMNKWLYIAVYTFLFGFVLTELTLIIQGCMFYLKQGLLTNYYLLLFLFSMFLPLGIFMLLFNIITHKNHEEQIAKTT
ncbi:hypothetical protein [Yeosuana marina]|uniref:hypothetical protein n=1 Tax=Yeosuana marina TaxID=1565536 RepID=UPI0030C7C73E